MSDMRKFMQVDLKGSAFRDMIGEVEDESYVEGYGWVTTLTFPTTPLGLEGDLDKKYGFGVHELSPAFITPEEYDAIKEQGKADGKADGKVDGDARQG